MLTFSVAKVRSSRFYIEKKTCQHDDLFVVEGMPMFIQRSPDAIIARIFMKTLFTIAATANRALIALNCIKLKINLSQDDAICLFFLSKIFHVYCHDHNQSKYWKPGANRTIPIPVKYRCDQSVLSRIFRKDQGDKTDLG